MKTAIIMGLFLGALPASATGQDEKGYEVWAIDQSNSPGLSFGGTLYIWDGRALENTNGPAIPPVERVDLGGAAAALCLAQTGANPVRPHMMAMSPTQSHAVISFVASGHILFLHAETRTPVACIRASAGAGGARQVHMATPSPDGAYVTFANQNGKLFERIRTDFAAGLFVHDTAATLNLSTCTTPAGLACESPLLRPDNAPICPITEATSRYTFVTLRGGGLFVVDSRSTPMQIVGEYDQSTVHGNGCLGAEVNGKMRQAVSPGAVTKVPTSGPRDAIRSERRSQSSADGAVPNGIEVASVPVPPSCSTIHASGSDGAATPSTPPANAANCTTFASAAVARSV